MLRHLLEQFVQHPHAVVFDHDALGGVFFLQFQQELVVDLVRIVQDFDHDVVFPEALVAEFLDPLFALDDEGLFARVEIRILQRILYKLGLTCLQKTGKQVDGHFLGHITQLRTGA